MNLTNTKFLKTLFCILIFSLFTPAYGVNVIKILAIGNSFSEDAVESYVDDLANADNVQVVIGNMFIGGCSLETHWNNANANTPAYSYRKIVNGVKTTVGSKTLQDAITDESWDYIIFQQVSQYSGKFGTYFPFLPNLLNYVKTLATNPNVQYCLHRTWAYSETSTHSEYDYYQKNQMIMYDSIVAATNKVADKVGINIIIPAGTAIQNGRSSYIGDNFNRDGYHLSLGLGRYTAACTWYEKLFGKSVINNTFIPSGVTASEAKIAQYAAHYALQSPNTVTSMTDFVSETPTALSKNININFGSTTTSLYWNNLTATEQGQSITNLIDNEGNNTGISITINDAFGGINTAGPSSTTTSFNIPASVSQNSFWGNAGVVFRGLTEPTAGLLLSGLNSKKKYDFNFLAARSSVTDIRETTFTVVGRNESTSTVDASNNTSNVATVNEISPRADGTISINIGAGTKNTNVNKFFYINAFVISPTIVSNVKYVTESKFKFYPNPVKDIVHVESDNAIKKIEIVDLMGKEVFVKSNIEADNQKIDLSSLDKGYYLLKCINNCVPFIKI